MNRIDFPLDKKDIEVLIALKLKMDGIARIRGMKSLRNYLGKHSLRTIHDILIHLEKLGLISWNRLGVKSNISLTKRGVEIANLLYEAYSRL